MRCFPFHLEVGLNIFEITHSQKTSLILMSTIRGFYKDFIFINELFSAQILRRLEDEF